MIMGFDRKRIRLFLVFVLMLSFALASMNTVNATNGNPYSQTYTDEYGVYHPGNCTWQAWEECYNRLGIRLPAWHNGGTWHTDAAAAGYQVVQWYQGYVPPNDCLIEWTGHVAWLISADSVGVNLVDGNLYSNGSYQARVEQWWSWADLKRYRGNPTYIIIVKPQTGVLDINGLLDGNASGSLGDYGTCDVYINGSRVADDVVDYCQNWPIGTTYSITDVKAKSGYEYIRVSSGSLSGTLTAAGANVRLEFKSYATLQVNGKLDGSNSSTIGNYGTFDVYINGTSKATGVNYYNAKWPQGTSYELRNIRASSGKYYEGPASGAVKGTLGKGTTNVRLSFLTMLTPTTQWQETTSLPSYLDLSNCEVEYNNHYKTTSPTSPGSGWTQGPGTTTYVDDGYEDSDFELATSATRVLQRTYYYHYCGASAGNRVNFAQNGTYTDYHEAGDVSAFNVVGEWTDDDDARYHSYKLTWKSGQWAGGDATCAGGRSAIWYKRYKYLKRKAVTNYIWTRDSGWTTSKDSSADSVTYRFRLASGRTLVLPTNLKSIGAQAFAGIDASVITIPNGCASIGSQAFLNCKSLTRLNIPASVTSIAFDAFDGCDKLVIYAPQGSTAISLASRLNIKYQVTQ